MKNISLLKVTLFVTSAALISSFVHANNDQAMAISSETTAVVTPSDASFEALAKVLDSDQNAMLSKEEVLKSDNKYLVQVFDAMDLNDDSQVESSEYTMFINTTDRIDPSTK